MYDTDDVQVFDSKEKALEYNKKLFSHRRQLWESVGKVGYTQNDIKEGTDCWAICDSMDEKEGYYLLIERAGCPKYSDEIKLIEREII